MNVDPREIANALYRNPQDSFVQKLVALWQKADSTNKARLSLAFPEVIGVCEEWYRSDCERDFFIKYEVYK